MLYGLGAQCICCDRDTNLTRGVLLRFQLERLGFFCVDLDSMPSKLVVNRTCNLKADFIKE